LKTWTRSNSRRPLVLARLAALAEPTPALPMRLLLTMNDVNIQGHRDHREKIKEIEPQIAQINPPTADKHGFY